MSRSDLDADRLERRLEAPVIVAALLTIPLTLAQARGRDGGWVVVGDWVVWAVFALEYLIMVAVVRDRWHYTRRNWFNVAIVILSFPALPELFALLRLARLARLTRLFRLVRLLTVTARGLRGMKMALGHRGLLYVVAFTTVLVLAGGAAISLMEPDNFPGGFWTGVWWGVVTATTVGYGDVAPVSGGGRLIAVVLMFAGVGLVATVAASVAAYFVGKDERGTADMEERLNRIEASLAEIRRRLD